MSLLDRMKQFKKDYIDNPKPPIDGRDPYWVSPKHLKQMEIEQHQKEYAKEMEEKGDIYDLNHFYDLEHECWVKHTPYGYVSSVDFDEWMDGIPDEGEILEHVRVITREDYYQYHYEEFPDD